MSPARSRSASSAADSRRPSTPFARAVAELGARPVLGALALAAARHRGLTSDAATLHGLTGSDLFTDALPALPAALEALAHEVAAEPGRLGELSAAALATDDRKRRGVFYTPAWAAALALDLPAPVLPGPEGPDALVLDPACGGGRFLLAAYERLATRLPPAEAVARLRGLDTDPLAVEVARAALYLRAATRVDEVLPVAQAVAVGDLLATHGTPAALGDLGAVIGNPPYRGGRFAPLSALGEAGRRRFVVAEYQVDPYVLFIEASLAALGPGGRLALVVPNAFMSVLRGGALRRLLAERAEVTAIVELPPATFGAGVETVVLRATAGGRTPPRVPVLRGSVTGDAVPSGTLLVSPLAPDAPWPLLRDDRPAPPAEDATTQTFGTIGEVTRGINPYHHTRHRPEEIAARIHHADHAAGPDFAPELRGRDLQPFRLAWSGRHWVRYGPWLKEPRDPRFFEGPRLLVRKILGPTLIAAYTDTPFYCDQSVYVVKLRPTQPWPPLALLACLGSRFVAELLRTRHQEHDTLFPQLKVAELRGAPLPPVSPDDPAVTALAAAMARHLAAGAPEEARGPIDAAVDALYHRAILPEPSGFLPTSAPVTPEPCPMPLLTEGARLPEFSLSDDRGRTVTQADFAGRTVVLYFYPKDDTPGCTREACAFRDGLEAFEERGATVIGISADDVPSHEKFRDKYELNHPLLADPEHKVCEAFGVWGEQSFRGTIYQGIARTTYLVRDGVIAKVYPDVDVTGHAERILADL